MSYILYTVFAENLFRKCYNVCVHGVALVDHNELMTQLFGGETSFCSMFCNFASKTLTENKSVAHFTI